MATPLALDSKLLVGCAQALANPANPSRVLLSFKQGAKYTAGETGIYFQGDSATVDSGVWIRLYPVQDSTSDNDVIIGMQFEIRSGSVDFTNAIAEDIRALLHRAWNVTLGGVLVSQSFRQSGSTDDADGRITRTENYYLTVNRP
ncbi:minor capsid protein [Curtobacterium phage Parvaparticeps]|nr:minor capsid protein [Curtobacterium phage Parvaparticeps]